MKVFERDQQKIAETREEGVNNFDHWAYSEKKHAIVFYFSPMFQYGFNDESNASQIHQDAGAMYRWQMVETDKLKINFQGWVEQSGLIAGNNTKEFISELGIISPHNASDEDDISASLESFFVEAFLLNRKWDITIGRFDPLFLTTFTDYSGWDKYNYFAKTTSSDPVPTIGSAMGLFSEFHINKRLTIGGLIADDQPKNDYLYIPDFNTTTYAYMGFFRLSFPGSSTLVSSHNFNYYFVEKNDEAAEGRGFIYTGNQGISEKLILIMKLSYGEGRVDKLNGAYALGLTRRDPWKRAGDQAGIAAIVNEKSGQFEYGFDAYYKLFIRRWISLSGNLQVYYGINDKMNYVPGFRAFLVY